MHNQTGKFSLDEDILWDGQKTKINIPIFNTKTKAGSKDRQGDGQVERKAKPMLLFYFCRFMKCSELTEILMIYKITKLCKEI